MSEHDDQVAKNSRRYEFLRSRALNPSTQGPVICVRIGTQLLGASEEDADEAIDLAMEQEAPRA